MIRFQSLFSLGTFSIALFAAILTISFLLSNSADARGHSGGMTTTSSDRSESLGGSSRGGGSSSSSSGGADAMSGGNVEKRRRFRRGEIIQDMDGAPNGSAGAQISGAGTAPSRPTVLRSEKSRTHVSIAFEAVRVSNGALSATDLRKVQRRLQRLGYSAADAAALAREEAARRVQAQRNHCVRKINNRCYAY